MAHIVSTLGNADFGRQVDVYKIAGWGDAKCQKLWSDFAHADPDCARLVVSYVEQEKRTTDNAKSIVDGVLTKAKKPKKKKSKVSKSQAVQIMKALSQPAVTKATSPDAVKSHQRVADEYEYVKSMTVSHDPWLREYAKRQLGQ